MNIELPKIFKILLGIIATIVLGAIGSGLWERFLGPALDWLTKISVGAFSRGHTWYRDSIYENAAKGFHEAHSLSLYTLVFALLPLLYVWLLQRHPTEIAARKESSPVRTFISSRRGYWAIFVLAMVVFVTVTFNTLRLRHINETITYSLAAFEIVRPAVGDVKYTQYRSRFYSIRTAAEFQALHNEVKDVARAHSLRLPDYEPL